MSGVSNILPNTSVVGDTEKKVYTNTTVGVVAQQENGDYWQDPALIPYPTERFGPLETALVGDPSRIRHPTHFAKPGSVMVRQLFASKLVKVERNIVTTFTLKEN